MLDSYRTEATAREAIGIPPLPLTAQQTADLIELLKNPPAGEEQFLLDLFTHRVPAGVDDAAKVKASYLASVALGKEKCLLIDAKRATELLGTMLGGYNIGALIELLDHADLAPVAADALKKTLLVFDAFHDIEEKAKAGNVFLIHEYHAPLVVHTSVTVVKAIDGSIELIMASDSHHKQLIRL